MMFLVGYGLVGFELEGFDVDEWAGDNDVDYLSLLIGMVSSFRERVN